MYNWYYYIECYYWVKNYVGHEKHSTFFQLSQLLSDPISPLAFTIGTNYCQHSFSLHVIWLSLTLGWDRSFSSGNRSNQDVVQTLGIWSIDQTCASRILLFKLWDVLMFLFSEMRLSDVELKFRTWFITFTDIFSCLLGEESDMATLSKLTIICSKNHPEMSFRIICWG